MTFVIFRYILKYSSSVARAKFVAGARRLDFSLDEIQEILDLRDKRIAPCRVVLDLLEEKADEISRRIAELQRMEAKLRQLRWVKPFLPMMSMAKIVCATL